MPDTWTRHGLQTARRGSDLRVAAMLIILALDVGSARGQSQPAVELRGVWLNSTAFATDPSRTETLRKIEAAHLNTIFAIAPPIGDNRGSGSPAAFAALISGARSRNLSVHAWICNHRRLGQGQVAEFRDPRERQAQVTWALALLAEYPDLDGIHFDYIRYDKWEACDATKMNGVTETIAQTRAAMRAKAPGKRLTATSFVVASPSYRGRQIAGKLAWQGDVPQWYRDWYAFHPDNWYSQRHRGSRDLTADMLLGPNCFSYQQDSPTWVRRGLVDGLMPMQYTADAATWRAECDLWRAFLGEQVSTVYYGLGWLRRADRPDWRQDPAALIDHIRDARASGARGFVIFELGSAGAEDWDLVRALVEDGPANGGNAPFRTSATSPLRP